MKILVALKHVPDTETKIKIDGDGRSLDGGDVKWITSPYDEYAIEEGLRIKEAKGAEVTVISFGNDKAKDILRNGLALGADTAIHIKGQDAGDPFTVARQIAHVAKDKGFDLVLCGNKGFGADNGAMPSMLAELLNASQANLVTKLELGEGTFKAEREGDGGVEVIEGSLPAVISAQRGLNEPRYAGLKGIMAAKKKPIEEVEALSLTPALETVALELPKERAAGRRIEGSPVEAAASLVKLLKEEAKVL